MRAPFSLVCFAVAASGIAVPCIASPAPETTRAAVVASTERASAVAPATTAIPSPPDRLDPTVFRCGPILAQDPAVRAQIEGLYKKQWDLQQGFRQKLKDLAERRARADDAGARAAISREGTALRSDLELGHMELGLQIARLNGDVKRVAEFESALDEFRHPERSTSTDQPDPDQARRVGSTKDGREGSPR